MYLELSVTGKAILCLRLWKLIITPPPLPPPQKIKKLSVLNKYEEF